MRSRVQTLVTRNHFKSSLVSVEAARFRFSISSKFIIVRRFCAGRLGIVVSVQRVGENSKSKKIKIKN